VRAFPKAGPRKFVDRGGKKRKVVILADTPNKQDAEGIEEEESENAGMTGLGK
jgi:hypothetical protein